MTQSRSFLLIRRPVQHKGQPTVILAKTIKGYGMGDSGQAQNTSHQQKKMSIESITDIRDRWHLPVTDKEIEGLPYLKFCRRF